MNNVIGIIIGLVVGGTIAYFVFSRKKEDKKDKVKETLEETIKNTVTREFTSLLAKNGGRVTLEEKQAPVENVDAPNLTAEQIQLAEKYGVDKVQYAKDLANERKRTQI